MVTNTLAVRSVAPSRNALAVLTDDSSRLCRWVPPTARLARKRAAAAGGGGLHVGAARRASGAARRPAKDAYRMRDRQDWPARATDRWTRGAEGVRHGVSTR